MPHPSELGNTRLCGKQAHLSLLIIIGSTIEHLHLVCSPLDRVRRHSDACASSRRWLQAIPTTPSRQLNNAWYVDSFLKRLRLTRSSVSGTGVCSGFELRPTDALLFSALRSLGEPLQACLSARAPSASPTALRAAPSVRSLAVARAASSSARLPAALRVCKRSVDHCQLAS